VGVVFIEHPRFFLIVKAKLLRRMTDQHVFTVKDQLQPSLIRLNFTRKIETTIFSISNFYWKGGIL
jgi:hypothetical protein